MKNVLFVAALVAFIAPSLAGCGNTIRGIGQDTANTVDATQSAASNTADAVVD
ncbi:entericidin [Notoacmeibacter sp. MSK16QG-6]|uniref:entericidin domain-containing protein n=1 Tax=Notoacmeibacter sp. MSK16QG-6 TaxID=2957982 RepID=UPI0020A0CF6B|nr:entericidin [Notoacmeibacter sp. MSK16QG-6]MCP1198862.1 entericidin [Notoacmeibacter sp. MSK16QG-6]